MKFDRIVGFGDSWMWGDELLDPALLDHPHCHPVIIENTAYRESHCFLGLLGAHYGVPTENFGWPGGSMQSTIWCYLWWLRNRAQDQRTLILVAHTDANRTSFYNPRHTVYANDPPWNRFLHSSWVHAGSASLDSSWVKMVKLYSVLTDCPELSELNYMQTVLFFQGQQNDSATVLQFCVANPPLVLDQPTLLWPDRSIAHVINTRSDRRNLLAPHNHPNEKGHEVIRDQLISEIDRVILTR